MQLRLILLTVTAIFFVVQGASERSMAELPKEITNSIGMKLLLLPTGTFTMGSPLGESERRDNERQHSATISGPFWLGIYEVTQSQYEGVMGENPCDFEGADRPVESVSWEDAVEFCRRLSALREEREAGRVYRLPTEAEWEYACRAGSTTAFSFGDDRGQLGDHGWFSSNSGSETHPVGQKQPNAWGLYDMHGNVWEWCGDFYGEYPTGAVTDPEGPKEGLVRVLRGGSWGSVAARCRSSYRLRSNPSYRLIDFGFRVALGSSGIPE
jgi:formylglycine-generating enzyme required for sulfatase activity